MESLDEYFKICGVGLRPDPEKIKREGEFIAKLDCLQHIDIWLSFDDTVQGYEPYLILLHEHSLEKSIPELIKYFSKGKVSMQGNEEAIEFLIQYVKSDKPYSCGYRNLAVLALGELEAKEAAPIIAEYAANSDEIDRWWAVKVLAKFGCEGLEEEILKYLRNERVNSYRLCALRELEAIDSEATRRIISRHKEDEVADRLQCNWIFKLNYPWSE